MRIHHLAVALSLSAVALLLPITAAAHCQVPCGIYTDDLRFASMAEDLTTLEKAMTQIEELSKAKKPNYNQIVRWVVTKEEHAEKIVDVITNYFLMQRIKRSPAGDVAARTRYESMLEQTHGLLVLAMKCTQTTDRAHVEAARKLLHEFQHTYQSETK